MAQLNLTQAGSGVTIDQIFAPSFTDAVYRNNDLLGLVVDGKPVFPELPVHDSAYRWKVNSAGNTSAAVFSEGDSMPTPVAQTFVNAAVSYVYFWA